MRRGEAERAMKNAARRRIGTLRWLAPSVGALAVRLLGATLRLSVSGMEAVTPRWRARQPVIYAMWHGRILLAPWINARLRRRGVRAPTVLTSRSRDGEAVARFARSFGLGVVRGSSSRGGTRAVRELIAIVRAGDDVVLVPDGPRGPARRCEPGVVALAAMTGAPIVPLGFAARRAWTLRTWDRFTIPRPFSRAAFVFGAPIDIARDADRERAREAVERALDDVTTQAQRLVDDTTRAVAPDTTDTSGAPSVRAPEPRA